MDRGSLSDPTIVDLIKKYCVPLRVYVDKHPGLCKEYRVPNPRMRDAEGIAPYPSIQLWTPSGVIVSRADGLFPPHLFLPWLAKGLKDWASVGEQERVLMAQAKAQPSVTNLAALARFYLRRETYRKAAETWLALGALPKLKNSPIRHTASMRAGHAYLMHADYERANLHLKKAAVRGAQTRPAALFFLGFSAQQQERAEMSFRYYREVLRDHPGTRWWKSARRAVGNRKVYY